MAEFPHSCRRVRELASCDLDGTISELERQLLRGHLRRCPECAAFSEHLAGITELIRAAPLEPFALDFRAPVRAPRRSSRWAAGVAAATAVSAAVLGIATNLGTSDHPRPDTQSAVFTVSADQAASASSLGGLPGPRHVVLPLGQLRAADEF